MPEIPLEAVDAAAEAHRKRCEQLHAPSHNESATLILRTALPYVEQAIRNEERVKVLDWLHTDEAVSAVANRLRDLQARGISTTAPGQAITATRALAAALATLDQEEPSRELASEDVGDKESAENLRLDQEEEAPVAPEVAVAASLLSTGAIRPMPPLTEPLDDCTQQVVEEGEAVTVTRKLFGRAVCDPGSLVPRIIDPEPELEHDPGLEQLVDWSWRALLSACRTERPAERKPVYNGRIVAYEPVTVFEIDHGGEWQSYVPKSEYDRDIGEAEERAAQLEGERDGEEDRRKRAEELPDPAPQGEEETERLRKALQFYADHRNYEDGDNEEIPGWGEGDVNDEVVWTADGGWTARAALGIEEDDEHRAYYRRRIPAEIRDAIHAVLAAATLEQAHPIKGNDATKGGPQYPVPDYRPSTDTVPSGGVESDEDKDAIRKAARVLARWQSGITDDMEGIEPTPQRLAAAVQAVQLVAPILNGRDYYASLLARAQKAEAALFVIANGEYVDIIGEAGDLTAGDQMRADARVALADQEGGATNG